MITQLAGHTGAIWDLTDKVSGSAIDLGGTGRPLPQAGIVVDLDRPDSSARWIKADLNDPEWSAEFSDGQFDWVWCNHTLEDIRDPIGLLRVITRIGKRALIGTPHWTYECGVRNDRSDWEAISGFPHHRWLVGINKDTGVYEFMAKQCWFVKSDYEYTIPNLNVEWDGGDFSFQEITNLYPGHMKKSELLAWLEGRWLKE